MFRELSSQYKLVKVATRRKRGDVTEVADQTAYSPSHVSNVLAGRRNNLSIVNTAYRKVRNRESQLA